MIKDFYIFRHGQSTYNIEGRSQGQTDDSVLTDLGMEQAGEIGRKLKNKGIEIIVSSPLKRALQTAEIANKSLNVPIVKDNHFIEVNVGAAEGLYYNEIITRFKDIFDKLHSTNQEDCFDVCYPDGETRREVQKRIWEGLNDWCVNQHNYKTIAISSHGIALAQIMSALNTKVNDIKNGAILHIQKDDGVWKIIEMM